MTGIATISSLSGCLPTSSDGKTDYSHVVDIPISGWTVRDTLFYPITVTWPAHTQTPLLKGIPYGLSYSARISASFPLSDIPLQLIVQQTDTVEGHTMVVRNLLHQEINLAIRDNAGFPLGKGWGSYIDYEAPIDSITLRFDSVGTYRMLLTPRTESLPSFHGIASIGLHLHRKF